MNPMRSALLAGSQNAWLRERAMRWGFVRRSVSRFMPGETAEEALAAAAGMRALGIKSVLTRLGENVRDEREADAVTRHYLDVLERVKPDGDACEISVKLTQLGLDLDRERCFRNLGTLTQRAQALGNFVWIDMEQSNYVDVTLEMARLARGERPNVGVCVQSYLYRTPKDLAALLSTGLGFRLVKGAYNEPASVAYPARKDVDAAYLALAKTLLGKPAREARVRAVFGTHDPRLIEAIRVHAAESGIASSGYEFHLLFGIQRGRQKRLADDGNTVRVLISYGESWFPWYMRRLAERPANVWFVVRNLFG
jgi:proline dehydrogenase